MPVATANGQAKEPQMIILPDRPFDPIYVRIRGKSPLIVNRFGESAIEQIEIGQSGGPKPKKMARDPEQEFMESIYRFEDGRYGFPAIGIKHAMKRAVGDFTEHKMTEARAWFHVVPETEGLVQVMGSEPVMRTDRVKLSGRNGVTSLAYRAMFPEWFIDFELQFYQNKISAEAALHILSFAGEGVGIGQWRIEKDGTYGTFLVDKVLTPEEFGR